MSPKTNPKPKPEKLPPVPCAYGCGRNATGGLLVSFSEFSARNPSEYSFGGAQRGFSASVPACGECARGSVRIDVTLPKAPR